jgi:hypothetical protein
VVHLPPPPGHRQSQPQHPPSPRPTLKQVSGRSTS